MYNGDWHSAGQTIETGTLRTLVTGTLQALVTGTVQILVTGTVQPIANGTMRTLVTGILQTLATGSQPRWAVSRHTCKYSVKIQIGERTRDLFHSRLYY
jgi:hypothetical protein